MLSGVGPQSVTGSTPAAAAAPLTLPMLERLVIAYLTLPLGIFLLGWLQAWVAVPLLACLAFSLRPLIAPAATGPQQGPPVTHLHVLVAIIAGLVWTYLGGTAHFVFANADWHVRDAILHDLVVSPWPVGYGAPDGHESMLRAPLAYYLMAALAGKWLGLYAAHLALAVWTALGASLFLLQMLSLTPSRVGVAVFVVLLAVLFSGLDIIGCLINIGPRFLRVWHIDNHIEWWAGSYQYSSMSTQFFWVPNHALGGWLTIGLLCRDRRGTPLEETLPIVVVASALWSPLTTLGAVPFVVYKVLAGMLRERSLRLLHPRVWAPALAIGLAVAGYLLLDSGSIPKGWAASGSREGTVDGLLRQAQFFLLEAGLIGFAVLALRRSGEVVLALLILAILPIVHLGPANDLVMRASIPSLVVLMIGACLVLIEPTRESRGRLKKGVLGGLLLIGAVTPVEEIARAVMLPAWPINREATLIGVNCGGFPAHYVGHLDGGLMGRVMRAPHRLALGPMGRETCTNPAWMLMYRYGLMDS
jgi:hypothetical protein